MMAYNPYFDANGPDVQARPKVTFTRDEAIHLAASVGIMTIAAAFTLNNVQGVLVLERFQVSPTLWLASFLAVASGFVPHELAHKIVAQRYMHWAEFRGWFRGLWISLGVAAGLGILFAAPGAVQIWGRVTPKENGIISLVGPAMNFFIALLMLPFALTMDVTVGAGLVVGVVCFINSLLCAFNLLPILNLDGLKVMRWNKPVYFTCLALAIGLQVLLYTANITPV